LHIFWELISLLSYILKEISDKSKLEIGVNFSKASPFKKTLNFFLRKISLRFFAKFFAKAKTKQFGKKMLFKRAGFREI
jgi:hypothetical protein